MSGPCAKRRVICVIMTPSGETFVGENSCENPQPTCPREPGEGYEKCRTVCRQAGHAEREAVAAAKGADLRGSSAFLTGHYWMCEPCGAALRDAGIEYVKVAF